MSPTDLVRIFELVRSSASGTFETSIKHTSGSLRTVVVRWTATTNPEGTRTGYVGTLDDITERKALEARLSYQATHDSLTRLPNRLILNEHLKTSLARARRSGEVIGVVFLDLDRFKIVNDSLGHETGDRLLEAVATRMSTVVRSTDVLGRFGGDEFVLITTDPPGTVVSQAITNRLNHVFDEPFDIGIGRPYHCTASLGVAWSAANSTPESLLRDADVAMYLAKERGRDVSDSYDDLLHSQALDQLALERDLPSAIANREMVLLYQPIVEAKSGKMHSVEALMRWDHPTRGRLSPEAFIALAEETDIIISLGDWALEKACTDVLSMSDVTLNVNISGKQVHDDQLVTRVARKLLETGFPPDRLVLEIAESVLVDDIESTINTLTQLKHLGVSIAVDDVGIGLNSLSHLSRFPVDFLKIDTSIVSELGHPSEQNEIARCAITLAHELGMQASAEGVETMAQLDALNILGSDSAQGFHFHQPLSIEAIHELHLASL
jgi:diguanylate cyclase (GGDEF)-like protein